MIWTQGRTHCLAVTAEGELLLALPGSTHGRAALVVAVALSHTPVLLASGGETAHLTMLVGWRADPVDARITGDSLVAWIDADDLEVLEGGIL